MDIVTKILSFREEIKRNHPEALLLYRCGDFYEAYFEDAIEIGRILNKVVTKENGVERLVFPHYAIDTQLPKLIRSGHRVAICDLL